MTEEEWKKLVRKELRSVDRDTISMWNCAVHERMPPSHSVLAYGIDTLEHVLAIKWMIECRQITPKSLDAVKKSGPRITELIRIDENPHTFSFHTIWDKV